MRISTVGLLLAFSSVNGIFAATIIDTGAPDGFAGMESDVGTPSNTVATSFISADDFVLNTATKITGGSFTGLIYHDRGDISRVVISIYGVDPTLGNPAGKLAVEDSDARQLMFSTVALSAPFAATNSVPGLSLFMGPEFQVHFTFEDPLVLPAGHYFFAPQAGLTLTTMAGSPGPFFWLSARWPTTGPTALSPDLPAWIMGNPDFLPFWSQVGADLSSGPVNGSFSLTGDPVPEPATDCLLVFGLLSLPFVRKHGVRVYTTSNSSLNP